LQESANPEVVEEAGLILARIYRNTGRLEQMAEQYNEIFTQDGPEAARAVWEWGRELESAARWDEAESVYTMGLESLRGTRRYRNALFRRGFDRVRLGRPEDAAKDFRAAYRESRTPSDEEQALFWLARTLFELGRDEEAKQAATAGMGTVKPAGAYGILIRQRFLSKPVIDEEAPRDTTEIYPSLLDILDFSSWPGRVKHHYLRGLKLTELGEIDGGRKEWERAYAYAGRNVSTIEGLAVSAAAYNMYPQGVRWARRAADLLPHSHPDFIGFERLSYPAAYYGDVVAESRRHGVNPFSVWALMRQESLYDPIAVSRVGALGLMQIMPYTLTRITHEAGMPPMSADVLFRPQTNITLGTRFLSERLEEFEHRMLPALASYNAGEEKAREWLDRADGDDQEVFIECIGFPETYDYVRRILWLNWVYEDYYGGKSASTPDGLEAR
jgi:soluble lytic murein transglycosylase